jgi:hypothetical protein
MTLKFFEENVDNWGALEWFNRMARAVREADKAILEGRFLEAETARMVASSSATHLVREFEHEIREALTNEKI